MNMMMFADVLCVTVVQAQDGWGVTYTATDICAIKGSTVNISCTYTYPSNVRVQETFWFTKGTNTDPVDLKTQSEYSGRVQYQCKDKTCTLTIRDLRDTDSAQYKFRFITNQQSGHYTGSPGVTLTVTDLQVKPSSYSSWLDCHNRCDLPGPLSYVWYKNGQKTSQKQSYYYYYSDSFNSADSYSCAVATYEHLPSPSVLLSVSVSPSAEIVEGSSVTLTCSNDANPAASYTWYKKHGNPSLQPASKQFNFSSIQSSDSGEYYCTAENDLGRRTSGSIFIHVTYPPKLLSVSVSPSAEIVEGSSVTLTCSSDANPAANYTWSMKHGNPSLQPASKQFIFSSIQSSDSGEYYCTAENELGRRTSGSIFINVTCESNSFFTKQHTANNTLGKTTQTICGDDPESRPHTSRIDCLDPYSKDNTKAPGFLTPESLTQLALDRRFLT
uniref:B-cell receptor CD22 n=1 Tax=Mastacembelus armatus TaxID=205130 RepID=A0A3Q3KTJ6_9TELE